jgi:hypothetical protein
VHLINLQAELESLRREVMEQRDQIALLKHANAQLIAAAGFSGDPGTTGAAAVAAAVAAAAADSGRGGGTADGGACGDVPPAAALDLLALRTAVKMDTA